MLRNIDKPELPKKTLETKMLLFQKTDYKIPACCRMLFVWILFFLLQGTWLTAEAKTRDALILHGKNLVPNSSFEVGAMERRWTGRWEEKEGFHGTSCATLPPFQKNETYVPGDCRRMGSKLFYIPETGQPYVLSAYMKASKKQKARLLLRGNAVGKDNPPIIKQCMVDVDVDWKRVVMKVDSLPACPGNAYSIQIKKVTNNSDDEWTLYVDAIQLEKGTEPTAYEPMESVAFGLRTAKPRNVFDSSDIKVDLFAYNRDVKNTKKDLEFIVKDFWGKTVFKKELSLDCPGAKAIKETIAFNSNALGSLRCELYELNGLIQDEIIVSVLPPIAMEERNLAYAYGGKPDNPEFMVYPKNLGLRYGGRWLHGANWDKVQPDGPDSWDWSRFDKEVADCEASGIKAIDVYLGGCPEWARNKKAKNRPHAYGFDLDDWERYISAIVKRYAGRVDSWGIWNEPYFHQVEDYFKLTQVTYPLIKKANPNAEVCALDCPPASAEWAEAFIKLGGLKYMDALTTHAYESVGGYIPGPLARVAAWANHDGRKRPIYDTETQTAPWWSCSWYTHLLPVTSATSYPEFSKGLSAEEGAQRWTKLYITQKAMEMDIIMPHLMLVDRFSIDLLRCTGGNEHDLSLSPKLTAWAAAGRIIGTAKPLGEVMASPILRVMLFAKGKDAIAAVWTRQHECPPLDSEVPGERSYRSLLAAAGYRGIVRLVEQEKGGTLLTDGAVSVDALDMMGNPLIPEKSNAYPVTMNPIYLVAKNTTPEKLANMLKNAPVEGFGKYQGKASVATGPQGEPGLVIAVRSVWAERQNLEAKLQNDTNLFTGKQVSKILAAQGEYEMVLPFKNPKAVSEKIGPFTLTLGSGKEQQTLQVPAFFLTKSYKAKKKIKLDGLLNEWGPEVSLKLDNSEKILYEKQRKAWRGTDDSSLIMKSCWDEEYLYFAYDVTDNEIYRDGSPDTMYKGDCMEMFFDANVMGDLEQAGIDSDDIRILAGPSTGNRFPGGDVSMAQKGVKTCAVKTPKGYTIEVAIPWNIFLEYGAGPYAGTVIGFTVNLYDRDYADKRRAHSVLAWTEKPNWFLSTTTWGRLLLVD